MTRSQVADETVKISNQGFYKTKYGYEVKLNNIKNAELWNPKSLQPLDFKGQQGPVRPRAQYFSGSVVDAIYSLKKDRVVGDSVGVLNFASAYHPGGGFLNGSMAQEEALAYCSDLYFQQEGSSYYELNRAEKSKNYTDNAIWSETTFFRDSKFNLLNQEEIYKVNILTCPAVNMGELCKRGENTFKASKIMYSRMRFVLQLFASKKMKTIILGAWGCGVFGNDSATIALCWQKLLVEEGFAYFFDNIIFAVMENSSVKSVHYEDVVKEIKEM